MSPSAGQAADGRSMGYFAFMSRWSLHAQALVMRQLAYVGFALQHRANPPAESPTRGFAVSSTLGRWQGEDKFRIEVYESAAKWDTKSTASWDSLSAPEVEPRPPAENPPARLRPALINFHGGGFVLGSATDDARWCGLVANELDAVVFSVEYRMAPSYPFPTPVEDCADAILAIVNNAAQHGIDRERIYLSGFSAGGNLALSSWLILNYPERFGYTMPASSSSPNIHVKGMILFYPLLDWSIPRESKRASSVRPDRAMSPILTSLFREAYFDPTRMPDLADPLVSPGLMPDELMAGLPPVHMCCCEWDELLPEAMRFRAGLEGFNKEVSTRIVNREPHGWDKPPTDPKKGSVLEEYAAGVNVLRGWLRREARAE